MNTQNAGPEAENLLNSPQENFTEALLKMKNLPPFTPNILFEHV